MSFPRYPKYKASGVEWLGEVPEGWDVARLKNVLAQKITDGPHTTPTFHSDGVPFLSVDGIQDGELQFDGCRFISHEDHAEFRRKALPRKGDLLMGKAASTGKLARVKVDFEFSIWSPLALIRLTTAKANPAFFEQWLKSPIAQAQIDNLCTSNTQKNISMDDIPRLLVTIPPLSEQTAIAEFLDRETGKIDELVAEQRRLMELLKEKRQAVISHAVTKGLNPHAPMKPSGIEWLGDVPEHWRLIPFRSAIRFQEGPGIMAVDFHDEGIPLLRISGVQGRWATTDGCNYLDPQKVAIRWEHFRVRLGDLLISASASMGSVCEVGPDVVGAVPYTGLIRLTPNGEGISRNYIRAVVVSSLFTTQIDLLKAGATIQHFGPTHLSQMKMLLPPVLEQDQIAEHINRLNDSFDTLTAEAQRAIDLLQERRTALISAAVTGQIDVRQQPRN